MKQSFQPVAKKQQKQKTKFRPYDEDYFEYKPPTRDDYKRKLKHRNSQYWESDS